MSDASHAEPFIRASGETGRYLTVTPEELAIAAGTGREELDRLSQFASAPDDKQNKR